MASVILRRIGAATVLVLGMSLPAIAASTVSQERHSVDACTRTLNAMGGIMSHKPDTSPEGKQIYRFVLRTNGLDYDVVCDAATGLVSDVAPRVSH